MAFGLFFIGLILVITAAQDTYVDLGRTLKGDFTGKGSFVYWALAIVLVGALGYVKPLRPFSIAFMGLVLLVLLLNKHTFFQQLMQQINAPAITPATSGSATPSTATQGGATSNVANSNWLTSVVTSLSKAIPGSTSGTGQTQQDVLGAIAPIF